MTDPVDINPDQLRTIQNILRYHLPAGFKVWVFGSRVDWSTKDTSDLDLAVEGPDTLDYNTMIELEVAFEESNLPYTVDVVDLKSVSSGFRKIVEGQRVPLPTMNGKAEMKDCWREVPISAVSTAIIGGTPRRSVTEYWKGILPWATAKDVANADSRYLSTVQESITELGLSRSAAKMMPKGTILITSRGTVGAIVQLSKDMAFNQTCYALVPKEDIDNDYLYYALNGTLARMRSITYGTIFQTITTKSFDEWQIPLPSLSEQQTIAHILGTLDDKIELNRRMNETLEEMARAIFKDWFVDFGPVRAKMEGRKPYLPPDLWELFPDRLVDSEMGDIPEGWEVKTLGKVVNVFGGTTPSTKQPEYWKGGKYCWATPKDLSNLSVPVLLDTKRKITDKGLECIGSGLQPEGTVLLSSRAPIGYLAINEVPVAINQGFIAIQPRKGISNLFLLYWCKSSISEILNHANGSTFLEISKSNFRQISIITPSLPLLNAYQLLASSMHYKIVVNVHSSRLLVAQRDTLLPKLVSGKLKMPVKKGPDE